MPVAERDDLVAFQLFVPAEADVIATLFGRSRRTIAVNDRDIEKLVLVELHHRAGKNGVDAAIGLPPSPRAIDPRVVNLRTTFAILVDRQLLPLTTQIKQVQNVVSRRDGHYWPSPAQIRTGPIKASGSYRGYLAASRVSLRLSACGPAPVTRFSGSAPGACF